MASRGILLITMSGEEKDRTGKLFIHLRTSNGFQTIKCSRIEYVIVGDVEVYNNMHDISNYFKAKSVYYALKFPSSWVKERGKKYAAKWKNN